MGRSSSKLMDTPNDPLQELQYKEVRRQLQKRKKEKEQKQIAKLQKKHANKRKKNHRHNDDNREGPSQQMLADRHSTMGSSLSFQSLRYDINTEAIGQMIEKKTHAHLEQDLCMFLMNQISFATQFYKNYESEVTTIAETLLAAENDFNQNLEEHSILLTNPLDVAMANRIQYKPIHGADKHKPQLLQAPKMYVVFENIDVSRPNDANYDSITPLCKVDMDTEFYKSTPCRDDYAELLRETKWKGYVRLKLRENPKMQRNASPTLEDIYTDGSSGYSTASGYASRAVPAKRASVGKQQPEYDYAYITHLNAQHPLSELTMGKHNAKLQLDAKVLPESCVSSLENYIDVCHDDTDDENDDDDEDHDHDDDDDDDDDDEHDDENDTDDENHSDNDEPVDNSYSRNGEVPKETCRDLEAMRSIKLYKKVQKRLKMLLQQRYLNSKEFMRYFSELLREKLASQLCIPQVDLESGSYCGAAIYTRMHEIVPAIHVPQNARNWPDCAFQFRIRDRPISNSPLTGQQFQWPSRAMIKRIESFGFHIIPMGYAPKRQRNPFRELEWRIVFPKAERYLERHLTSTQVKVFMMTKALVKTFVEASEQSQTLTFVMDHLRMHLFWECERNFTAWPEEFLGEVLIRFIDSFMQRLRKKCLSDFFIEERNLFESIPEYSLMTLYTILADITANPLMHLMVALRNLDFAESFFPKLNFKKIFNNLREKDVMKLKTLAKSSRKLVDNETEVNESAFMADDGPKGLVGMRQHREKTNGRLRRKTQLLRHNIEIRKMQELEQMRRSVESIDVEYYFNQNITNTQTQARLVNQGIENLRRTNLLELLLDHLLAMTEKAVAWRVIHLAKSYALHARKLCKFYHTYGCDMAAKEYLAAIQQIESAIEAAHVRSDDCSLTPPALPIRTSVEPIRTSQCIAARLQQEQEWKYLPRPSRRSELASIELGVYEKLKQQMRNARSTSNNSVSDIAAADCRKQEMLVDVLVHSLDESRPKSIKFVERVVEVHEGDSNSRQKPQCYSPVSILRFGRDVGAVGGGGRSRGGEIIATRPVVSDINCSDATIESHTHNIHIDIDDFDAVVDLDGINTVKIKPDLEDVIVIEEFENNIPPQKANTGTTTKSKSATTTFLSKFGTATGILKYTPLAELNIMKSLTTSTEKILSNINDEEKRAQLREMLKQKTVQLRGAFNQSSDT